MTDRQPVLRAREASSGTSTERVQLSEEEQHLVPTRNRKGYQLQARVQVRCCPAPS